MKPLSDEAIKRNWVEVEHQLGFTSVGEDEYKDFYFDHARPLAQEAQRYALEQVVDKCNQLCQNVHHESYNCPMRACPECMEVIWQELKKLAEVKK